MNTCGASKMKLWDIIKTVGTGIISTVIPGSGPLIVGAVNAMLPKDKQLAETATGDQLSAAIGTLPPDTQAELLNRKFDVEIKKLDTLQVMLKADAQSTHTTRPKIAYQSFQVIAFCTIAPIAALCYSVVQGGININDSWPLVIAITAPLVTVLHAYFGVLTEESKDRLNAAQGHKVNPIMGLAAKFFGKGK